MRHDDGRMLCALLQRGASLEDATRALYDGRLSMHAYAWFGFLWTWSAPRFGGAAGYCQDRAYARIGADALKRRHERVLALAIRIMHRYG